MKKNLSNSKFATLSNDQMKKVSGGEQTVMEMINTLWNATPSGGWSSWHNNGGGNFHGITSSGGAGIYNTGSGQISWL